RRGARHPGRQDRRPARDRRSRDCRPARARRRDLGRDRPRRRSRRPDPRSGSAGAEDARTARPGVSDGGGGLMAGSTGAGIGSATGAATAQGFGSYILFVVAGTTYALPTSDVRHMEMVEDITRVPNSPSFVDGVVFSRGQVVPVVNLRAR